LGSPELLLPQVELVDVQLAVHHGIPVMQLPCLQSEAVVHGSPMFPAGTAQMDIPPGCAWHVKVPARNAQSALDVQPGKQMSALFESLTQ
jgi:hypothetical protein